MSGNEYYAEKLSALRLKRCYDIASPRIRQYLEAEINYVLDHTNQDDFVLELGCGYGRVMARLAQKAKKVYGIDNSDDNISFGRDFLKNIDNIELFKMNAKSLSFSNQKFDLVVAVQNGISAFKVDPYVLIREGIRVTKLGGKVLLSSYAENFWEERLDWFIAQSEEGLLGEIDFQQTKNGIIVCKDGFEAKTFTPEDFSILTSSIGLDAKIVEVDQSSVFCVIDVNPETKQS